MPERPTDWKSRSLRAWRNSLRPLLILILVLSSFRSAVADWNDVPTGSMKPTIMEGDRILVNKLAYGLKVPFTTWHLARWNAPARGEIVVFNSPEDGIRLVKRIVGVPGDTLRMVNNQLFINGSLVEYEPLDPAFKNALPTIERSNYFFAAEDLGTHKHAVIITPRVASMRSFDPITIPAGQYFMMGDNRDNSRDSRYIGLVPVDNIVGRSSTIALSLDYDHWFLPRWGRFFKSMP